MPATQTRFTPEDLLEITDRPMPELVDGQLVEREPMGQDADGVTIRIVLLLGPFSRTSCPGEVNGPSCGYQIFAEDPARVRFPDVSFTRRERVVGRRGSLGHSRVAPDLAVEVVSPNDNAGELEAKVREYLGAGIPMVWVVYPESETVHVYRADGRAAVLAAGDALDGGDVLPGFRCQVAEVFA